MAAPLLNTVDKTECQFCGEPISTNFRRTFGDNEDIAHRCTACDTDTRIEKGSAAGLAVPDREDPADDDVPLKRYRERRVLRRVAPRPRHVVPLRELLPVVAHALVELRTENPDADHATFSREPYRVAECTVCGQSTEVRLNNA